ncbi:MAG: putative quinol monooxygenase [Chromatocurvus sp.]
MLAIIAKLEFTPADMPAFMEAAKPLIHQTRVEEGCELYAMATDIDEPGVVWISEQWSSLETLNAHLASPHIAGFMEKIATLNMLNIDARQYEVSSVGPVDTSGH